MSGETSNWIPSKRIRFAVRLALVFAGAGVIASLWSWWLALLLLVPAVGAGSAAIVMVWIRRQLSPRGGGWERRIHQHVVSRLSLSPEAEISLLDVGCGDASLIVTLLDHAPRVEATGVDFWGANWDYAKSACETRLKRLGRRATFRRMDAARLDFPDASFDAVVSVMCFHEVKAPRRAKLRGPLVALSEALRVLRPGGQFVFIDRFADAADYGEGTELAAVLNQTTDLRRDSLVATLGVPWPLKTKRALGPVEVVSGQKAQSR